jgi:hypothetical protein
MAVKRKPSAESYQHAELMEAITRLQNDLDEIDDPRITEHFRLALDEVKKDGDFEKLIELTRYRRTPVDMDEFLYGNMYLGLNPSELFPGVTEALYELESGNYVEAVLKGAIGGGKRLCVNTPILTPRGWSTMGELKDGDQVYDDQGNVCNVVKAHDPEISEVSYRVYFSDETHIDACAEHLWYTDERQPKGHKLGSVKTTQYIKNTLCKSGNRAHSIPLITGLQTQERELPIHPYVFGAWLGDGNSSGAVITCHNNDYELIELIEQCGYVCSPRKIASEKCPQYRIDPCFGYVTNTVLRECGVLNNKHIPDQFLYGSHEQRVALLQGLMDTDGYIRPTGSCEITQVNGRLADDIMQLLWLLGLKPLRRHKIVRGVSYHRITFTAHRDHVEVFRLTRKLEAQPYSGAQALRQRSRTITCVERIAPKLMRCITVDSPNRLYLAGRQMQITHNTSVANIGILRQLYLISCLRNPQATFGVQRNSSLVFTIQSVRLSTAKKAVFQEMGAYIANSPYFNKIYPYDKRITSEMIFREQHVTIMPVSSSDTGAISLNVIGGLLDEMNFMQKVTKSKQDGADMSGEYDQAKNLYLNLSKRRRSRFMSRGKLPGILFLVSSSRYPDDFTEIKAAEAEMCGGPDPQIYVWSKSLWESKGRQRYSDKTFRVLVGNEKFKSRIMKPDEAVPDDMETIEVPEDFRSEFVKDIDGSIRDLAGRTTLATRPFLRNREAIFNCMNLAEQYGYKTVHNLEEVDLSLSIPQVVENNVRTDVKQMRVCHVDLAVTRDSAGLAIGHVAGTKTMQKTNFETGEVITETLPVIAFDVVLRIVPPQAGEIDFSLIRQIIFDLKENYGLPIKVVTTDGFNSVDFRQILAKKGYATDYLSVDRTTQPYVTVRDAINDGRLFLPRHQWLLKELVELEYVRSGSKEKVDHRERGSKDIADAVCGVTSYLMTRRLAWTQQPAFIGQGGYLLHGNRTYHDGLNLIQKSDEDEIKNLGKIRKTVKRRPVSRRKSA